MLLAIDSGNTRTKAAVFEASRLLEQFDIPKNEFQILIDSILKKYSGITDIIISSVAQTPQLQVNSSVSIHQVSHSWKFPFVNLYQTPTTLGADRMVLAAGAVLQFPGKSRLVIDAGTCITYDFIDEFDNYLGGAISPGIRLRYEALHNYTARLPLLSRDEEEHFIGKSTASSIHSGVINGIVYEINGFIARHLDNNPNFIIILTGGDAVFLAKRLKYTIFANSNFLLESLNKTFQYKIKND